ncbi:hypothetical protein Q4591_18505 [Shewanella sp. 3_MG-2023]|uniref:DUF6538 domain-containing protein n=1 Tax=Shewanella sp. 3_MG-2023 TaxID=3062635 RepID=UPI0026E17F3A|nr:DUF6538 domain-containing protein [Shewanella sp. 3_MG-2023]MDO6777338.1 hypothetical protein [Shewanella sp. 3_MG-2023]
MFLPVLQTVPQTGTPKIPYTFQRNGVYYLRVRIPKIIQENTNLPPIMRQSLQTKSSRIAITLVNKFINHLNDMRISLMAKSIQMNFASVMTFHDNGKPQSLTKYDSGNNKSDAENAIKHSVELEKLNIQHRVTDELVKLEEGGMRLSEAIEAYKDWKQKDTKKGKAKGLSDKAAKARYTNFEILLLALGDKDIDVVA